VILLTYNLLSKDSSGTALNLYGSDGESKFYMQVRDNMTSTEGNGVVLYTDNTESSADENLISQKFEVVLTDVSGTADADATGIVTISTSAERNEVSCAWKICV